LGCCCGCERADEPEGHQLNGGFIQHGVFFGLVESTSKHVLPEGS
jgi:hypothetical protein